MSFARLSTMGLHQSLVMVPVSQSLVLSVMVAWLVFVTTLTLNFLLRGMSSTVARLQMVVSVFVSSVSEMELMDVSVTVSVSKSGSGSHVVSVASPEIIYYKTSARNHYGNKKAFDIG